MAFNNPLATNFEQSDDGSEAIVTVTGPIAHPVYDAIVLVDVKVTRKSDATTTTDIQHFFASRTYAKGTWTGTDDFNIAISPALGEFDEATNASTTAYASCVYTEE